MTPSPTGRPGTAPRYALVGAGHRARMFVDALAGPHADGGTLAAICDTNPTRARVHRERHGADGRDAPELLDPSGLPALLDGGGIDGLIVCTPDATHAGYVTDGLDRGLRVLCEKPLVTTAEDADAVATAARASSGELVVTFNYRYSPRNSAVRELIADGAIGAVTSVNLEWVLDTRHGADYFRRWHRDRAMSGGLLVHKATHHFDLVNWWLDDTPVEVVARTGLHFYGDRGARAGEAAARPRRSLDDPGRADDPFALDLTTDPWLRSLYLDAESHDGYQRDLDVFSPGVSIEDNATALVRYSGGAVLTYSLNAHSPWEGYRVSVNGTRGRIELEVVERGWVPSRRETGVDPSAGGVTGAVADSAARPRGVTLTVQPHWEHARTVEVPDSGPHGGGDALLLDDLFGDPPPDPLRRRAGWADGVRAALVGIAAGRSAADGAVVRLQEGRIV